MILWGTLLINTEDQRMSDEILTGMYKEAKTPPLMNFEANFVFYMLSKKWFHKSFISKVFSHCFSLLTKLTYAYPKNLESTERRKRRREIKKRKK